MKKSITPYEQDNSLKKESEMMNASAKENPGKFNLKSIYGLMLQTRGAISKMKIKKASSQKKPSHGEWQIE
jgi:hypothetical protein